MDIVVVSVAANPVAMVGVQGQETPLHAAVELGHMEIAKLLVEVKADVNARDKVVLRRRGRDGVELLNDWQMLIGL
jgi:predicted butyrate kinase (DUF1464 family)